DVACVNGRFVNFTGFGEAWMRAGDIENPAGAVSYAGATTNMEWVPPIHVQAEMNKVSIANEVYKTTGGIFINGIMKGRELYTTDPKKSGVMMFEQWHLYGDGTMNVRFKAPITLAAESRAVR
ncbi:MAG TPA: C25 family cysteine peptidase, partial [Candidatus Rifleibacterium sp.]|nr:C25 family cysteine peptidase [Candidatus Rifleibacterium sp.]